MTLHRQIRVRGEFFVGILGLILTFLTPTECRAARFSNQFAEFELPAKWQCNLEGAEWVCQSTDDMKRRDAIMVLAAKLKGDADTMERYQQYLSGPRIFTSPTGASVKSTPRYTKSTNLNGAPWIDSLHLESEIPGFYTRYLATVKQDIGVLVTYSINKNKYAEYQPQFEDMVKSLKVFRKTGGLNQMAGTSLFNQNSAALGASGLGAQPDAALDTATVAATDQPKKKQASGTQGLADMIIYGALALGVIGFIAYKKRKGA